MRILLDATTEVGRRAGRVLFGEAAVDHVGVWDAPDTRRTARSGPADDVGTYDVAVTDRADHFGELLARCAVAGVPLVLWHDAPDIARGGSTIPVVTGANVGSALSEVLAFHPSAHHHPDDQVEIAWTEPGRPLRSGTAVAFPEPIAMSWTRERSPGRLVAFRDDDWSGAVIKLDGPEGQRIIGVADHGAHLEALVLAATALSVIDGAYETGVHNAAEGGEHLMNRFRSVELDFAVWRSSS